MKIITRQEAREQGLKRYFTGKPCIHGHHCERLTASKNCIRCLYLATEKRRKASPDWQERRRERHRLRRIERRASDPAYAVEMKLRRRMLKAVSSKSSSTRDLTGCTFDQLMTHLESQFVDGMTWENHSDWHIDHIKPCASFDLTDPEQQKQCFHYKNLQPLWAAENLAKGARYNRT